ncbi:hypothetical protein BHM03_00027729 [Ensete ventricosum]|nr:hypothetical protein BHM03_00027729 [Ensete ventricosum]
MNSSTSLSATGMIENIDPSHTAGHSVPRRVPYVNSMRGDERHYGVSLAEEAGLSSLRILAVHLCRSLSILPYRETERSSRLSTECTPPSLTCSPGMYSCPRPFAVAMAVFIFLDHSRHNILLPRLTFVEGALRSTYMTWNGLRFGCPELEAATARDATSPHVEVGSQGRPVAASTFTCMLFTYPPLVPTMTSSGFVSTSSTM